MSAPAAPGQPVLTYRPLGPADAPRLHEIGSDWAVVRQLGGWPWPPDRAFTESRSKPYEGGEGFVWGVFEGGRLVGSVGVTRREIGYMFDLADRGRGIARAAVDAAIGFAFASWDWPEIRATTWADNPASARVLARAGFVHWSTRYERSKARRLPVLLHRHRLTRARWEAGR
ncbi:GNAT family N-acetyltransferase [Wenxinia marina]|uniref:Acetyltransferase n=1 Tax=Wenxinia marina DSM 24838 TaxID=1123501 RepID=A0A0D0Q9Q1_9RHOB|nr:GNAT family N-acetyltransferase [Wenxinia marina]KIQ67748.1 Acetyltransferase [Wenxinia marina DSM 24838]GGL77541.1 hypothetical protein GCM10011392_34990 [Wenxinia marina]